ncbi:prion-inhibition and propagation-domain-containing protein [Annulohypoxylon moriforme]|nr:prion-inhibition and propagation-domain-containing protein [Annulohypoxylon moriforme]
MADPLSILGAAVGVTSLAIQMTDECIKGFKMISEAANMPEAYNFLSLRFQMEQQRFLNFGLEAGILYDDGKLCDSLNIKCSILVSILTEMNISMEKFMSANGKYEKIMEYKQTNWNEEDNIKVDIRRLLRLPGQPENEARKGEPNRLGRVRGLGKSISRTGRSIRTIAIEPKRLIWAAMDKDKFQELINRIQELNSFLIALLDRSQVYRLQQTMDTSYLELLQMRDDIDGLSTLVKALALTPKQSQKSASGYTNSGSYSLSGVSREDLMSEKKREYLKQLVEIKIQLTRADKLDNEEPMNTNMNQFPITDPLPLNEFKFTGGLNSDISSKRDRYWFKDNTGWVEWTYISTAGHFRGDIDYVRIRISLLTDLLSRVMPAGFRAPTCIGYIENVYNDNEVRFGMVFKHPSNFTQTLKLITLHEMLGVTRNPSLSKRMELCALLARSIFDFHAVNWLHKGLRSDNILFFASSSDTVDLCSPYVSGFELSRPSIVQEMTETPEYNPSQDIYRHPLAQSNQTDGNYRKCYDIYSLGVILIEIALWNRIENIVGLENLPAAMPPALQGIQKWLLGKIPNRKKHILPMTPNAGSCLQQLDSACGEVFRDVVQTCLTIDKVEISGLGSTAALKIQSITEQDILRRLENIQSALKDGS